MIKYILLNLVNIDAVEARVNTLLTLYIVEVVNMMVLYLLKTLYIVYCR